MRRNGSYRRDEEDNVLLTDLLIENSFVSVDDQLSQPQPEVRQAQAQVQAQAKAKAKAKDQALSPAQARAPR